MSIAAKCICGRSILGYCLSSIPECINNIGTYYKSTMSKTIEEIFREVILKMISQYDLNPFYTDRDKEHLKAGMAEGMELMYKALGWRDAEKELPIDWIDHRGNGYVYCFVKTTSNTVATQGLFYVKGSIWFTPEGKRITDVEYWMYDYYAEDPEELKTLLQEQLKRKI